MPMVHATSSSKAAPIPWQTTSGTWQRTAARIRALSVGALSPPMQTTMRLPPMTMGAARVARVDVSSKGPTRSHHPLQHLRLVPTSQDSSRPPVRRARRWTFLTSARLDRMDRRGCRATGRSATGPTRLASMQGWPAVPAGVETSLAWVACRRPRPTTTPTQFKAIRAACTAAGAAPIQPRQTTFRVPRKTTATAIIAPSCTAAWTRRRQRTTPPLRAMEAAPIPSLDARTQQL
mmetsp:Transcript_38903/g.102530  ORF Transcript_38903/g.102530 Transcript_38903/m.102530 type:complete len:234 (-) Transcript_38903:500-1201(-)